jgi:hypothetical protein
LPPLLLLSPAILTVSKNIMQPAKVPGTALPVKTAADVAIALKMVAPAAFVSNYRST